MKITNLILPIVALTTINNNNQVQAARVEWQEPVNYNNCYEGCAVAHAIAAKVCCAVTVYFPPAFVACQLAASGALATCIYLCNNPR